MIAITSISPTHINEGIQLKAVNSWIDLGLHVISMNCKKECDLLEPLYPMVEFVETTRTMEVTYGKPYVSINAVLDFCKNQKENHFCIINSDIEIKTDKEKIENIKNQMNDSIILVNRVNYDTDYIGKQYKQGIDGFFINRKFLSIYPQTVFCFGICFWDYWIPYMALLSGINVYFIKNNIAYHKNHAVQYSKDSWLKAGRYFLWEHTLYQFNPTQGIGEMSNFVYKYIYENSKQIEI